MINHRTNLQIFESRAYFQSYIHVLNRLKNMVIKELPFEKEIIKADFDDLLIKKDYKYGNSIKNLIRLIVIEGWNELSTSIEEQIYWFKDFYEFIITF